MSAEDSLRRYKLGEAVAALGVILSLLFVGVQIRQTATVAGAQAAQDLAAMSQDFLLAVGGDPETYRVFQLTWFTAEPVTPLEENRAVYLMIAFVRRAEAAFAQVQRGLLDENALDAYGTPQIIGLFVNPRFVNFWSRSRQTFNPAFVAFVESRSGYQPATGS
jgi:hypothetical protein